MANFSSDPTCDSVDLRLVTRRHLATESESKPTFDQIQYLSKGVRYFVTYELAKPHIGIRTWDFLDNYRLLLSTRNFIM